MDPRKLTNFFCLAKGNVLKHEDIFSWKMLNLSFGYLVKSIWKDMYSMRKLKELWRKITLARLQRSILSVGKHCVFLVKKSKAFLYPVMGHIISYTSHKTPMLTSIVASTGRGSACIPLIPCMWAPQGHFKVQFNSPAWFIRITFLLLPCWGWCLLPALSHPTQPNPAVQQPPPGVLTHSCTCCCCPRVPRVGPCLLPLTNPLLVLPMKWWQKQLSFLSELCLVLSEHKRKEDKGNFLTSVEGISRIWPLDYESDLCLARLC